MTAVELLQKLVANAAIVCTTDCGEGDSGKHIESCPFGWVKDFLVSVDAPAPNPKHRIPDFFDQDGIARFVCECGTVEGLHEFGRHPKCEYFNHHCDACHERGACTAHDDEIDA